MSIGTKPAYPIMFKISDNPNNFTVVESGLTFRERLIVAAVQGLCANPHDWNFQKRHITDYAIEQADAVIAALEKKKEI